MVIIDTFVNTCLCADLSMRSALAKPFASQMFHLASYVDASISFHTKKVLLFGSRAP